MAGKRVGALAGAQVPDAAGMILATAGQHVAVRRPVQGQHPLDMPLKRDDAAPNPEVPHTACAHRARVGCASDGVQQEAVQGAASEACPALSPCRCRGSQGLASQGLRSPSL